MVRVTIILFLVCLSLIDPGMLKAQNYSFGLPVKLDGNVNSPAEESLPLVSANGDKLYFVRTFHESNKGGKFSGQDIWISNRNGDNSWGLASNSFPALNNQRNNGVIGMSADGSTIYLLNAYNPNTVKIHGIAKALWIGNEWSNPYEIKIPGLQSDNSFIGFYVSKTDDAILISMNAPGAYGAEDLYICVRDDNGKWKSPENLGATINTKGFEISPFLSDDGNVLFFASDGHNGYGGSDIFMSRRLYDSWVLWSKPINLGPNINSAGFDAYLTIHADKEAYFVSARDSEFADIYQAPITAIESNKEVASIDKTKYKLTETEIQELLGMPVSRSIYFEFGSFDVAASSRELIYFLTNKLIASPEYTIELVGNTSAEGTDEFNMELSLNRAKEVAKYFLEFGIMPNRIFTSGVGESNPIVKEGTEEELSKNRRVEIYFVK
jgi:outer membrane protein OmpA-like peptidoglycan-associated protein